MLFSLDGYIHKIGNGEYVVLLRFWGSFYKNKIHDRKKVSKKKSFPPLFVGFHMVVAMVVSKIKIKRHPMVYTLPFFSEKKIKPHSSSLNGFFLPLYCKLLL